MRGFKLLIIALCIFKVISAAPAPQSDPYQTTTDPATTDQTTIDPATTDQTTTDQTTTDPATTPGTTTPGTTTPGTTTPGTTTPGTTTPGTTTPGTTTPGTTTPGTTTPGTTTPGTTTPGTTTPGTTTPGTTTPGTTTPETTTPGTTTVPQSNSPDLTLPISINGTCGPTFGTRCPDGTCCSGTGACGETPAQCQAGCQPVYGVCGIPDIIRNKGFQFNSCTENNTLAITFDDGPRNVTSILLDHLKEKKVKATFFMNGHALQEHCIYDYADIVKRAYEEGHQIASHTWSHPHLEKVTEAEVRYQIEQLEVAFKKIIGAVPTYFRPPFGERSELVQQVLREKGYKMIIWDIDTNDYKEIIQNSIDLYNTGMNNLPQPNPHMILNHDRVEMTPTIFAPFEIDDALRRGYKVTTVGDCTGKPDKDDWYKDVGKPQERDETWTCTVEDMHGFQLEL